VITSTVKYELHEVRSLPTPLGHLFGSDLDNVVSVSFSSGYSPMFYFTVTVHETQLGKTISKPFIFSMFGDSLTTPSILHGVKFCNFILESIERIWRNRRTWSNYKHCNGIWLCKLNKFTKFTRTKFCLTSQPCFLLKQLRRVTDPVKALSY
jgi:hypothetical protein